MTLQGPDKSASEDHCPDTLLGSLIAITGYHGHPVTRNRVLAGLPLVQGKLTPSLLVKAVNRLGGYRAKIVKRPLLTLHPLTLPAILLMKDQYACVLMHKPKRRQFEVYEPLTGSTSITKREDLEESYTGYAILIKSTIKLSEADGAGNLPPLKGHWFWSEVRRLWPNYVQVVIGAALINLLALATPLFIMNVYDRVLPNKAITTLWVLVVGMGIAVTFDFALRTVRGVVINAAGRRADVLLAERILEHVMAISMSSKPQTTGSFANQLREFDYVREFFTSGALATLTDLMFFGLFLFVIGYIGGPIALVPAVAVVIVVIVAIVMQIPLRTAAIKTQMEASHRHSLLVEVISSLETVKLIGAEGLLQRVWDRLVGKTAGTLEYVRNLAGFIQYFTTMVQQLVTVSIIIVGAYLFQKGDISMGAIIACVILGGRSVAPFGQFSSFLARSQQSFAALNKLNVLMALESESLQDKKFVEKTIEQAKIEFQNVSFRYPGAPKLALNKFNLAIGPGERIGIIGKIGSGKTTIARLLSAIYLPQDGNILIDGIDIRQFHPHELRRNIGVVTQDSELFFGTVRSNIMMGSEKATDEDMVEAARMAGVDEFVLHHPAGYDMEVGERGAFLSGGQRHLVCLARMFLAKPKLIFLDQPSGSLDLGSEHKLINHLRTALGKDQTLIISTHRHSMLEIVNRLVVIADGKVAADGPKEEVLAVLKSQASRNAKNRSS